MTTAKIIAAGCSALVSILGAAVWILAVGPIFNGMFPLIMENTPLYWFQFLHGDMIIWIVQMVYVIIVLTAAFAVFNVVASAFQVQDYDTF
jgi:TM2 domain-containing membrane protein YozV